MIEILNLNKFLLFEKENIQLEESINLFIGESSSGKSLIFKSFYEFIGESHIKEDFSISIKINNKIVKKERKNNKITYFIDDELSTVSKIQQIFNNVIIISQNNKNKMMYSSFFKNIFTKDFPKLENFQNIYSNLKKIKSKLNQIGDINSLELEKTRLSEIINDFSEVEDIDFDQDFSADNIEIKFQEINQVHTKLSHVETILNDIKRESLSLGYSVQDIIFAISDKTELMGEELEKLGDQLHNQEDLIIQEKIITKFKKKYNIYSQEEFNLRIEKYRLNISEIDETLENFNIYSEEYDRLFKKYKIINKELIEFVKFKAPKTKLKIEENLKDLHMPDASFTFNISETDSISSLGSFKVETLFTPNKGFSPAPMVKIASGGELSRILVSIQLLTEESGKILILDEIDTGLGGDTANSLAEKVKSLSKNNQVIYITHLPQMAKISNHMIKIEKNTIKDRTISKSSILNELEIKTEISRLMGDSKDIKLAEKLLQKE